MVNMNDEQKVKYIKTKKAERENIKTEIRELSTKRDTYIKEQNKVNNKYDQMLDESMIKAIRKQAAKKNITFE